MNNVEALLGLINHLLEAYISVHLMRNPMPNQSEWCSHIFSAYADGEGPWVMRCPDGSNRDIGRDLVECQTCGEPRPKPKGPVQTMMEVTNKYQPKKEKTMVATEVCCDKSYFQTVRNCPVHGEQKSEEPKKEELRCTCDTDECPVHDPGIVEAREPKKEKLWEKLLSLSGGKGIEFKLQEPCAKTVANTAIDEVLKVAEENSGVIYDKETGFTSKYKKFIPVDELKRYLEELR